MATFPQQLPLTGADYLLLAFDLAMQRDTAHGNVCHLVLELEHAIETGPLLDRLRATPWLAWVASLRFGRDGLTPVWRVQPDAAGLALDEARVHDLDAIPDEVFQHNLDAHAGPLLGFTVVQTPRTTAVVMRWHHALLDARGAEALASAAIQGEELEVATLIGVPPTVPGPGFVQRLLRAKVARDFLWRRSTSGVTFLSPAKPPHGAHLHFHRLRLSEAETEACDRAAVAAGAVLARAAFHLGITSRAIARHAAPRADGHTLLIPVPMDLRTRGTVAPVVTNQLGILFYRVPTADTASLPRLVRALTEQMRDLIRAKIVEDYRTLLDFCRWVPLPVLQQIVKVPTWGRMATFGFSDVAAGLDRIASCDGAAVVDAAHYPANMHPPGITVVFARHRKRLSVCVSWLDGALSLEEAAAITDQIRDDLLGVAADA